ncbi:MAG: dihydrolipoamide acetyltransferase family protein [bacterium]|jgi:2-oxoglutarate dehydrogenase E2 component (dihydrolipoamide succinyltransferase)|nr:2-oxo acid dehydrogenase subunit E2 [Betaproteobacteria bacterium]
MEIIMPQLGETVAEGTVSKWYKKVGDAIRADETLFDVETDKVNTEIPSPVAGVVTEIRVAEGVTAKVGVVLAVITEAGVATSAPAAATAAAAVPAPAPAASAAAGAWAARPGSAPAKVDGSLRLSPVVRKLAAEHGVDPSRVPGTGRDGRVTREDMLAYVEARRAGGVPSMPESAAPAPAIRPAAPAAVPSAPIAPFTASPASTGPSERIRLNPIRKRTAEHLARAWVTVPAVLQAIEVDFHKVDEARKAAGSGWKAREGFSLTYLPFIARAVSIALAKFPRLNSSVDGDELVLHKRINLGIAVDMNFDGLMVPVVKDVPSKSLPQIAREVNDLAQRARANRLKPDDLSEATYTLSNSGVFGTAFTAPIVNVPQVAILSTDGVQKKPVVVEGPAGDSIAIRPVGMLAQCFDHRAVDGAYSAAFLKEVKTVLETRHWVQDLEA